MWLVYVWDSRPNSRHSHCYECVHITFADTFCECGYLCFIPVWLHVLPLLFICWRDGRHCVTVGHLYIDVYCEGIDWLKCISLFDRSCSSDYDVLLYRRFPIPTCVRMWMCTCVRVNVRVWLCVEVGVFVGGGGGSYEVSSGKKCMVNSEW